MPALISIAIACFNGEKYLEQQLDSIFNQTYPYTEVIASVDKSTDRTQEILQKYSSRKNFRILLNEGPNGVIPNFRNALKHTQGEYVAFSDQDDVWLPEKLEKCVNAMQLEEKRAGDVTPVLVFSDLKITDSNLNVTSESYISTKGLDPENHSLSQLLIENIATGCTILLNASLKKLVAELPDGIAMHDVFCALTASCFGKIIFLPEALTLYRQHPQNVVGVSEKSLANSLKNTLSVVQKGDDFLLIERLNARAFLKYFESKLSKSQITVLAGFGNLNSKGKLERLIFLWQHGFRKGTFLKTLNFYLKTLSL